MKMKSVTTCTSVRWERGRERDLQPPGLGSKSTAQSDPWKYSGNFNPRKDSNQVFLEK